jgi:hypothetical protein
MELPSPGEMKEAMTKVSAMVERAAHELTSLAEEYGVHGSIFSCMDGTLRVTRQDGKWGVYVTRPDEVSALVTGASIPVKLEFLARYPNMLEWYQKDILELYGKMKEAEKNA